MTGLSELPVNLSTDVRGTAICGGKPVAVIELVLKLLWGMSGGEQRPPHVILDSAISPGA